MPERWRPLLGDEVMARWLNGSIADYRGGQQLSNLTIEPLNSRNVNQQKTMPTHLPVLVLIHYFGGAARSWQWVTEQLSDEYQCIALNLPGFGKTSPLDAPSIEAFAEYVREETERLGISSFTLLGHSMGGKIAVQVAADDDDRRVERLILIAPSPPTIEQMPPEEKERMLHHPDRGEAETTVKNAVKGSLSPEQHALAVATQLEIDEATWRWWLLEGMNHSIADQVSRVKVPITVLASDDDPVITPEAIQQEVMAVVPDAELVRTQGIGHLSPLEDPDWVAEQIRRVVHH